MNNKAQGPIPCIPFDLSELQGIERVLWAYLHYLRRLGLRKTLDIGWKVLGSGGHRLSFRSLPGTALARRGVSAGRLLGWKALI